MTRLFIPCLLLLFLVKSNAQETLSFHAEMRYANYLIERAEYRRTIYVLNKIPQSGLGQEQKDSLFYFTGKAYYKNKSTDTAAVFFKRVSVTSAFYFEAAFYSAFCYAETKKYDAGRKAFREIRTDTSNLYRQLKYLEEAGVSLLLKDHRCFDSLANSFDTTFDILNNEQTELKRYAYEMKTRKNRSPLVAGLLSATVPGLGKLYAGKKGEALASFLSCALFGAVAAENIWKSGFKSPQSIIFESLFGVFYIGNIYGSVFSVKLAKESFYKTKQDEILVTLRIPLRNLFGK